ncbi:hypothetical protein [Mycoplasmopsis adleri]|uniref:hypothetical protein n=1 Tax=Mycoplasmopsis adleri TaxID=51362 RepID=UPI003873BDF6
MTLEEKYHIVYENNKRYYELELSSDEWIDNTTPFYFKYDDIKIKESSWKNLTLEILTRLDEKNPKTEDELLSLRYGWSDQMPFSKSNKTNHMKFKELYLNTNWGSTHALWNIKMILKAYNVNLNDCYLLIKRHFIYEPEEIRTYIKEKNIASFKKMLAFEKIDETDINIIIKSINSLNTALAKISQGYDDFFLFDDLVMFQNYKIRILEHINETYYGQYKPSKKCLDLLEKYYKNIQIYLWIFDGTIDESFMNIVKEQINSYFNANNKFISKNYLRAKMCFNYPKEMETRKCFTNEKMFFKVLSIYLNKEFFYNDPFICLDEETAKLNTNDHILSYIYSLNQFSLKDISNFINNLHLSRPDNLIELIDNTNSYIRIDDNKWIKKESFNVNEIFLNQLDAELSFFISSFGSLKSEEFQSYVNFPKLSIEWNKYVLLEIVKNYLNSKYEIFYENSKDNNCSFKINFK